MKRKDGWYLEHGQWRKRYKDENGVRKEFIGYSDKTLSKKAYERTLDKVREILDWKAMGRPVTDTRDIRIIAKQYIAWGSQQGGKGGHPWSPGQRGNSTRYLLGSETTKGMIERMSLKRLDGFSRATFESCLADWENPKTRGIIGGVVKAFFGWCEANRLLSPNPLIGWPGRKMESDNQVRDLTLEEFEKLLEVAPAERALAYEFASYTGARAGEFNKLFLSSMKWDRGGAFLPRKATKAKKQHFFPLPAEYLARLKEHVKFRLPGAHLFNLSSKHKDRYFHKDRAAAGIPYITDEGKCTFHSLRHLFETELGFSSTDSATELELGRHTDMRTRRRYLHSRDEAKIQTVEAMAKRRKAGQNSPKKIVEK